MTLIDTGTYGAKTQSWKRANPRALLEEILRESPKADVETIRGYCRDAVRKAGEDFTDTIFDYWFDNNLRSLTATPYAKVVAAHKAVESKMVAKGGAAIKKAIKKKAKSLLLDTVLPNGKKLRDSTFGECTILGGWLSRIGRGGDPDKVVGRYLSEAKVRKLKSA